MLFKHPEILYFLFFLLIPILVHLFQLRRFKKAHFTNVRFLKEISIQTRKSSQIKKWLLLATRLLLLTFLIFAFTQPFFPAKDSKSTNNSLYLVIDNSFSMQAKGQRGPLLKRAVEDLLEHCPPTQTFSLITNSDNFWNTDIKSVQRDLQNLNYSALPFQLEAAMAKIKSHAPGTDKDVVIITDGFGLKSNQLTSINKDWNTIFVVPKAEQKENVAIDSVSLEQTTDNFYEIGVHFSASGDDQKSFPMALYDGDQLIAKTIFRMDAGEKTVKFNIPKKDFHGYVAINDNSLTYDNTLFFSISKPEKMNVLSIGSPEKSGFLRRIYTDDEFNFTSVDLSQLDYNLLEKQDALILNELTGIPQALETTLKSFTTKGGNLIIIPTENAQVAEYNTLLDAVGGIKLNNLQRSEKLVTKIAFSHPLFQSVFEKKISNFQYPKTKCSFSLIGSFPAVLSYEDQSPFLVAVPQELSSVYLFAAPLNKENSNFQSSPLIVPTFYNMVQNSQKTGICSFTIGSNNSFLVNAALGKDAVVHIKNQDEDFVPLQQILSSKVKLNFADKPELAGNYGIFNKDVLLKAISFNYDRSESNWDQDSESLLDEFDQKENISSVFDTLQFERSDYAIWKWFIALSLLFVLIEILIQKFVK